MSSMAILAPFMVVGIPCAARVALTANPFTMWDSIDDFPCALRTCTADRGYLYRVPPLSAEAATSTIFTDLRASTARCAKKSDSGPRILEDIDVFAELRRFSSPNLSTFTTSSFLMWATAAFSARRYPVMMLVGWIPFPISSLPRRNSSAATITTLVVPSPTSWSWRCASWTSTLAAGCSTSSCWRMVAPSLVMVTSPMSSTSILSRPTGPREDFTMLATAAAAVTLALRTSMPVSRLPLRNSPVPAPDGADIFSNRFENLSNER
mmetsp:Transcript_36845/g.86038  ORF Transcript_36845/g.86038 Transcript_36845/m.86038 type:complete len:265 (-) Transcript_36845:61-855(-)